MKFNHKMFPNIFHFHTTKEGEKIENLGATNLYIDQEHEDLESSFNYANFWSYAYWKHCGDRLNNYLETKNSYLHGVNRSDKWTGESMISSAVNKYIKSKQA